MRPLGPVTAVTLTLTASFALLVRVLSSSYLGTWTGAGAAALVTVAVVAFALHAWDLATGRGWKNGLQGEKQSERLAALERLLSAGRIRRAEYLEERRRLLRGP
ncbi:MAG: hypothetical protein LC620_00690 [Halobacteriales archaeon]|nr:hypothetical protein [Halobacteriales archaeon]